MRSLDARHPTLYNLSTMAIVNFSVPDAVKVAFDRAFRKTNKSAIVARLMLQAVTDQELARRRKRAAAALLRIRAEIEPVATRVVRVARRAGRP